MLNSSSPLFELVQQTWSDHPLCSQVPANVLSVVSWNINGSLMAKATLIEAELERWNSDVAILQEIKVAQGEITNIRNTFKSFDVFVTAHHISERRSVKATRQHGVAILTRKRVVNVIQATELIRARAIKVDVLTARSGVISVVGIYAPVAEGKVEFWTQVREMIAIKTPQQLVGATSMCTYTRTQMERQSDWCGKRWERCR